MRKKRPLSGLYSSLFPSLPQLKRLKVYKLRRQRYLLECQFAHKDGKLSRTRTFTCSSSAMSTSLYMHFPPDREMENAVSCNSLISLAQITTAAPSHASRLAISFPMPRLPPVTTATLPDRLICAVHQFFCSLCLTQVAIAKISYVPERKIRGVPTGFSH